MVLESLAYKALLCLPPETAHDVAKWGMQHHLFAPGRFATEESRFELFGISLDNPLGLAAGFDKDGVLVDHVGEYGFSYVEVGSVSYRGSRGNPQPRVWRLPNGSLMNRMGLNGDPAAVVVERLQKAKHTFGFNIVKTPDSSIVGDGAIDDIVNTYRLVVQELEPKGKLIYAVFNISCPNTSDGKTFEDAASLAELLSAVGEVSSSCPKLIKLSPSLSSSQAREIVRVADSVVAGYVCGNTLPFDHVEYGRAGLSGISVYSYAMDLIETVRGLTQKPIIGVGGIVLGEDAHRMEQRGASAGFQAFTSFTYGGPHSGPGFAHTILRSYFLIKQKPQKQFASLH